MCQGTINYHSHRQSLEAINAARVSLIAARYELGCDHPAYGLLGHMIDHAHEAKGRFPCRNDY